MSATAAFKGKLSISGQTTAFTGAACSLVSGKTYQVNLSAQRVLDPTVARTWKDNGVAVSAANIASEDLLFGKVTFVAGYTPTTPITLDGSYIPRIAVANVKTTKLDTKRDVVDTTSLNSSGWRSKLATLLDCSGSLDLFDALLTDLDTGTVGTQSFESFLLAATPKLLELDLDGSNTSVFRAWVLLTDGSVSLDPGGAVMGSVQYVLNDQGNSLAAAGFSFGAP